jgi:hypothetical protein
MCELVSVEAADQTSEAIENDSKFEYWSEMDSAARIHLGFRTELQSISSHLCRAQVNKTRSVCESNSDAFVILSRVVICSFLIAFFVFFYLSEMPDSMASPAIRRTESALETRQQQLHNRTAEYNARLASHAVMMETVQSITRYMTNIFCKFFLQ